MIKNEAFGMMDEGYGTRNAECGRMNEGYWSREEK